MSQSSSSNTHCEGWWEQEVYGRQSMEDLQLSFGNGQIEGSGKDIVGPFTFSGNISADGAVLMQKHYVGRHDVEYVGTYDGEGVMSGKWEIGYFHGPWMIRIIRVESNLNEIEEYLPAN